MNPEIDTPEKKRKLWLVTVPVLFLPLFFSFFYAMWFQGTQIGHAAYVTAKCFLIGWPILASLLILKEGVLKPVPNRPREVKKSIIQGTIFGLAAVALLFVLMALPTGKVIRSFGPQVHDFVENLGTVKYYWAFAFFLSFIHSFMEEFFWRWFVFGKMSRIMPGALAILLAAIGFASHHVVILSKFFDSNFPLALGLGICVGFGGAAWSWLVYKHNTLWGAWVSHMIIDLGIMWVGWELITA